jgi:hypothetical protein
MLVLVPPGEACGGSWGCHAAGSGRKETGGEKMDTRYLVYKCTPAARRPIACFDACSHEEAQDTLAWLEKQHGEEQDFRLAPGEFFEILAKDQVPLDEWEEAMNRLCRQKGGQA